MGKPNDTVATYSVDSESGRSHASSSEELNKPVTSWKGYIWDTFDAPKAERKLLFKLDAVILTFASLGYFLKNLDQYNVNNAFLSGMQEDLSMYKNELVTATSIWTVGYVIGQIPSNLLLTRISPRWVIPSLELAWGVATFCSSIVTNYKSLYALRFLVGLFESGFYPGIHYLLGSVYTPRELGKRAMIFWLAGSLGQLFSGYLQAAAYTNLSGVHGRAGWRWLFIIDGVITVPIALLGYFFFPNLPQDGKKSWWLSQDEFDLSVSRMQVAGRAGREPWTMVKFKRVFSSWHPYVLPLIYVLWNNGSMQPAMGFWLKSFNKKPNPVPGVNFSVPDINNLPTISTAVFIGMAIIWGWTSDGPLRGRRWPFMIHLYIQGRKIVYWLSQIGAGAGPLILTWINEICGSDTEKRALLVAAGNDFAYVVQAVAPNFVWKTTDFPAARKGYTWTIVVEILLILLTASVQILLWRDRKAAAKARLEPDSSSSNKPEPADAKVVDHNDRESSSIDEATDLNNTTQPKLKI